MDFDSTLQTLGINRFGGSSSTSNTTKDTSGLGKTEMDQSDFLTLMTAQLKNQDPFEPVDNTQMVAQMAQFSSLSGITEMSTTLKAIAAKLGGTSLGDALGYVGKARLPIHANPAESPARWQSPRMPRTSTSRSAMPTVSL
jgi:flagellar basal-body rod modification protein FlgD